jgi:hypothetical protein
MFPTSSLMSSQTHVPVGSDPLGQGQAQVTSQTTQPSVPGKDVGGAPPQTTGKNTPTIPPMPSTVILNRINIKANSLNSNKILAAGVPVSTVPCANLQLPPIEQFSQIAASLLPTPPSLPPSALSPFPPPPLDQTPQSSAGGDTTVAVANPPSPTEVAQPPAGAQQPSDVTWKSPISLRNIPFAKPYVNSSGDHPPIPPPSIVAFSGASAKTANLQERLLHMLGEGKVDEWNRTRKFCQGIAKQSPGTDLVKLQECADARAMLKAMDRLSMEGGNLTPGSQQWKENVRKIFSDAKLPTESRPVDIHKISDKEKIQDISKDFYETTMERGTIEGRGRISYTRKALPKDSEFVTMAQQQEKTFLKDMGMVVPDKIPIVTQSWDLVSRNRVCQEVAKKVCELSGSKEFKNPIAETYLSQNAYHSDVVDICTEEVIRSEKAGSAFQSSSSHSSEITPKRMSVLNQLTLLQFLDIIIGHAGRKPTDIMINETEDSCEVKCINNEFVLSTRDCDGLVHTNDTLVPQAIPFASGEVYHGIVNLGSDQLARIMIECDRSLDNGEFEAACGRLLACQRHLEYLNGQNKIAYTEADWQRLATDSSIIGNDKFYGGNRFVADSILNYDEP